MVSSKQHGTKLGLGTAQFGFDYGISNRLGQTPKSEIEDILIYAEANGIHVLDTAVTYGVSETVLGETLPLEHVFRIVTKIQPCHCARITTTEQRQMVEAFHRSLKNLRQPKLYGLLVQQVGDLLLPGGELLVDSLQRLKSAGLVKKIGVSVYTGEQIDAIAQIFMPDLIQLPLNLLDQRLIRSGHLDQLKRAGIEIHARSVFLQGLLLMDPTDLNEYFDPIKDHLYAFYEELKPQGISRLMAALDFVIRREEIDTVLVGVAALTELEEIASVTSNLPKQRLDYSKWALPDSNFLNPSRWEIPIKETIEQG